MSKPEKFTISFPDAAVEKIKARVAAYDWESVPEPEGSAGSWMHGADKTFMRELCDYWVKHYDWRRFETELNQFSHYQIEIDDQRIHYIHAKPASEGRPVVLMTHGWPGSVAEFMEAIPRLTHPENYGGDASQAVEVIAPSLPGYGFSGKPKTPIGPRGTAGLWAKLMQALGKETYIAQGGDWGSVVSTWIGLAHAAKGKGQAGCAGVHLNMIGLRPKGIGATKEEQEYLAGAAMGFEMEGAYLRLQSTKPQTVAMGLMDSPVGIAAWIVEKFHRWADKKQADGSEAIAAPPFTHDQLLDNLMIYLLTGTFATSVWFYRGALLEMSLVEIEGTVEVPCGFASFPGEFIPPPPRDACARLYNLQRWTEFERGGHFAAMEQPEVFAKEVAAFAHSISL